VQPRGDGASPACELAAQGVARLSPHRDERVGGDVLAACDRWYRTGHLFETFERWFDPHLITERLEIGMRANTSD